jgi:hypothetical protein
LIFHVSLQNKKMEIVHRKDKKEEIDILPFLSENSLDAK